MPTLVRQVRRPTIRRLEFGIFYLLVRTLLDFIKPTPMIPDWGMESRHTTCSLLTHVLFVQSWTGQDPIQYAWGHTIRLDVGLNHNSIAFSSQGGTVPTLCQDGAHTLQWDTLQRRASLKGDWHRTLEMICLVMSPFIPLHSPNIRTAWLVQIRSGLSCQGRSFQPTVRSGTTNQDIVKPQGRYGRFCYHAVF